MNPGLRVCLRGGIVLVCVGAGACTPAAEAVHVRFDTSAWIHHRGLLVVSYTTNVPDSMVLGDENELRIRKLTHDGRTGPLRTNGGAMNGDLILGPKEQATWSLDPDNGADRFFLSQVGLNFADREFLADQPWLGTFIRFDLELPAAPFIDPDLPLDAVAVYFLDATSRPGFPTADPLGADAILVCEPDRDRGGWRVQPFAPAVLRSGGSGSRDTIVVVCPRPGPAAGPAVDPVRVAPEFRRVERGFEGNLWVEYTVPEPGGRVRVRVLDAKGVERFRHESAQNPPGVYGVEWPERPGSGGAVPRAPAGRYRVLLEVGEHALEREVVLD